MYLVARISFFVFLFSAAAFAQHSASPLKTALAPASDKFSDLSLWKEIVEQRSIYSSSYLTPDGRTIIQYSKQPLNYLKDGVLSPVVTEPVLINSELVAKEQQGPVIVSSAGEVKTGNSAENNIVYSKNARLDHIESSPSSFTKSNGTWLMKDFFPGVDKSFDFRFNALEYSYILKQGRIFNNDLVIEEELEMPLQAQVRPMAQMGQKTEDGRWMGALQIVRGEEELGRINGALCYDAKGAISKASYSIDQKDGKTILQMKVSAAWLNDPARVYPVTVDPLVTGPLSTWTGGYIGSCISPASMSDSILVTIPPQITVIAMYVSGSYYASPFTTAVMSDGNMFFSTGCNNSTNFTVAPPIGSTAGTGYLTNYDLKNPLLCCKPQSCSTQTFYLSMHIQRTAPGTGCNTTYIYHDPYSGYPFTAYIEGRTAESFGVQWTVSPSTICSNVCTLTGTVNMKFGVPPFTITHPWAAAPVVVGTPAGCNTAATNKQLTLIIPGCPWLCDTVSVLTVPPPVVTDACGNTISGLPNDIVYVKMVPEVTASPNPLIACSNIPFSISLSSCVPGSTFSWGGNNTSGSSATINDVISNTGNAVSSTTYTVTTTNNGCVSATDTIVVTTDPTPVASFVNTEPVIINTPVTFTENSVVVGSAVNSWFWTFGDNFFSAFPSPVHSYGIPGIYPVCLAISSADGCVDTVCRDITVIPAELVLPNVITPNGDSQNDLLFFQYLEFFGSNQLKVYDRWGKIVYQKANYQNDWDAKDCNDGTYFYVLETEGGKSYPGHVQIIHK
jgi:gliding motility-associated-like protein